MFWQVKGLKTDSNEVERGSDGKLCFIEKERCKLWMDYYYDYYYLALCLREEQLMLCLS